VFIEPTLYIFLPHETVEPILSDWMFRDHVCAHGFFVWSQQPRHTDCLVLTQKHRLASLSMGKQEAVGPIGLELFWIRRIPTGSASCLTAE
jgi:hypothetical protein